jgi:hypothetical protein
VISLVGFYILKKGFEFKIRTIGDLLITIFYILCSITPLLNIFNVAILQIFDSKDPGPARGRYQ